MIENILSMLDKVKRSGNGYIACCPAHDDKNPSLVINETNQGQILFKCFAGCSFEEIKNALGLKTADMDIRFQDKQYREEKKQNYLTQKQREQIELDEIVLNIAKNMRAKGQRLTQQDMERERQAFMRVRSCKK